MQERHSNSGLDISNMLTVEVPTTTLIDINNPLHDHGDQLKEVKRMMGQRIVFVTIVFDFS